MSTSPKIEMIRDFMDEVGSYIPTLIDGLKSLKIEPEQSEVLQESHRLVHTIKGASSLVGLHGLSHIAFQMEEYLEDVIAGNHKFSEEDFRILQKTVEFFKEYCLGYMNGGVASRAMLKETVTNFRRIRGNSVVDDEQVLNQLLESVPENEMLPTEDKIEAEPYPVSNSEQATQISAVSGGGLSSSLSSGSVPVEDRYPVNDDEGLGVTDIHKKCSLKISPQLLESFYEEAEEHLDDLGCSLNVLENQVKEPISVSPLLREELRQIRRCVHTLKGAAAVIGFQDFAAYAHSLEDLLDWLFDEAQEISPEIVTVLAESSDLLERMISEPQLLSSAKAQSLNRLHKKIMEQNCSIEKSTDGGCISDFRKKIRIKQNTILKSEKVDEEIAHPDLFNELPQIDTVSELGLRFGKTIKVDMARFDDLVNLSGELIIALSAFDQKMDVLADSVNNLEVYRERLKQIARDLEVSYEVKALEQLRATPDYSVVNSVNAIQVGDFDDFDTLELDRYSELNLIIRKLNESSLDVGALHTQLTNLHSDFDGRLTRQRVILSELQNKMMRVRMTPFSTITNKLRRTVREVAGNLEKKVKLVVRGEDIELDKVIWEKIADPLMHLLRNAVDHGVESKNLRQSLGKPLVATIRLEVSREGNQIVIRIADDGPGLDFFTIQKTVRKTQLSDRVEAMSDEELSKYIFYPGFSTRTEISEISGRGMGMDVVKENILNLKGVIRVTSEKGHGTIFTIRIPLTLVAVQALLFTVRGQTYAVALNEISEIIRLDQKNILEPNQDALRLNDEVLPLFHMVDLLSIEKRNTEFVPKRERPITLVVKAGEQKGALVIDTLVGQKEIVIKNLGSHLRHVKGVSGATIMGDGSVIPILNLEELLWPLTTTMEDPHLDNEVLIEGPLSIMVVDDSVSIRQVVSRLMEKQGWIVQTAKDGIEALGRLNESRPDLIVLDIEMPRMNGYEFLGALKAQDEFGDIPVVMLTSRTATKHREKAKALGARGFIVKPYDDDEFLRLILNLTGRRSSKKNQRLHK
jgi:chemosensory pili system protein ChpA (sensor histidine kinase/response regulator)